MNILILTHNRNRHFFFANRLIEKTGMVTGVITGAKTVNMNYREKILRRIKKKEVWPFMRNRTLNIAYKKYGIKYNREKQEAEQNFFGGSKEYFHTTFSHLLLADIEKPYRSVNDNHYVSLVKSHKPDIIAVMGTCLISRAIIKSAPYVLNLHTGLSPYYRGSHTNLWPIIENDQGRFGVTVHRMSTGIDSGSIIYSARPSVQPHDTYGAINSKCLILGTDLMAEAISRIKNGTIHAVKQWEKGRLYFSRDWNYSIAAQYFKKRESFLAEYCRLEQAGELPPAELITNGRASC